MTEGHDATSGAQPLNGPVRPKDAIPARMALCRHRDAPDGEHLDLFLGPFDPSSPPNQDARIARSWRVPLAVWTDVWPNLSRGVAGGIPHGAYAVAAGDGRAQLVLGQFPAFATPPHRAMYLSLSEARTLDAGRGIVEPLAIADGWMIADSERCVAQFHWQNAPSDAPYALHLELLRTRPHAIAPWSLALSIVGVTTETRVEIP